MDNNYDIIVIGGGHNGLTTATRLAKKGKKVLLVERQDELGGLARQTEFYNGYYSTGLLQDTGAVRKSVIEEFDLVNHGLEYKNERAPVAILAKDGRGIYLSGDTNEAVKEIRKISEKDAQAYLEYRQFINDIGPFLSSLLNAAPPDLMDFGTSQLMALGKKGWALKRLGKATMTELLKVAPMCVADFLNELFETEFLKAGLAAPAIYGSYTGPWSSYTNLNLLVWEATSNAEIVGGPSALVHALEKAARKAGVHIHTSTAVRRITLDQEGRVNGIITTENKEVSAAIVASSCTPHHTFMDLFNPNEIDYPLEKGIQDYRSRGTTAKINLAFNQKVAFNFTCEHPIAFARTGNSIDEMEKAFDPVKYRKFSESPILDIHIPTVSQPELAPDGHDVVSILVHFAPYQFDAGWHTEQKKRLLDIVIDTLCDYIQNDRSSIVGHEVLSPLDLEKEYALHQGHIYHGEHAVDQLITRPIPACARYTTPIPGLFLCGSGSFPGGGITCAPGFLAAEMILKSI